MTHLFKKKQMINFDKEKKNFTFEGFEFRIVFRWSIVNDERSLGEETNVEKLFKPCCVCDGRFNE